MSRILFVTDSLQLPSDASQLKLLTEGLTARGAEVHVAAICDAPGKTNGQNGVLVHPLKIGSLEQPKRSLRHRVQLSTALKQLIESVQPNIVHHWNADARSELSYALRDDRTRTLVETISQATLPSSYLRQAIRNRLVPHAKAIAIPHESLRDHLIEAGYPTERVTVIPNAATHAAVEDAAADRVAAKQKLATHFGISPSNYLAVTVAPLRPRHRLKDLVWATDLLGVIRDDFHLVIVGEGQQQWRLRRFNAQTKAIGHVHFIDRPSDTLTADTIHGGADVYWNSHLTAPVPSPLLQAMAAGVPVISVLGPGTQSLIQHQATGFAVNLGARDEFARWTKYLIEQPHAAAQMSRQGQAFVQKAYPAQQTIDAYSDLYAVAQK